MVVLLVKSRDPFGASVSLWWYGENFIDIAPYINDARALSLPLLGGNFGESSPYGFHDWEYILTESKLILFDHVFAMRSFRIGVFFMFLALFWAALSLAKQWKFLRHG
jgi:hypothetical protein